MRVVNFGILKCPITVGACYVANRKVSLKYLIKKKKLDIIKKIAFWIGIAMIAYDMSGHLLCGLSRKINIMNHLWNNYSRFIYPSIHDNFRYDMHWTLWFLVAIILILIGRKCA